MLSTSSISRNVSRGLSVCGEEEFLVDSQVQDAIVRNLQVLAESSQRISAELRTRHSEIDWRGLAGFRNVLVHDYLGLNLARIWHIISQDLAVLKTQIEEIRIEGQDR